MFGLPRSEPVRLTILYGLAVARSRRYKLSSKREDLDKAILHFTETMFFPPRSWIENSINILEALFQLAAMLVDHFIVFKHPEDAIYASTYLRYIRDRPHQAFAFTRSQVTGYLVHALFSQVESKAGNVMEIFGEIADLCRELLTSDKSDITTTHCFTLFIRALPSRISPGVPDQPINQVIECLRVAEKHPRYQSMSHYPIGWCLAVRYSTTFAEGDYEEAASIMDEFITSSPGDLYVAAARQVVTSLALIRSGFHENPEYAEEALYRVRSLLSSSSVEHPPVSITLEGAAKTRAWCFAAIAPEDFLATLRNPTFSQMVGISSEELLGDVPEIAQSYKNLKLLKDIILAVLDIDVMEIDEAVEKGRTLLPSTAPNSYFTSAVPMFFGMLLFKAFDRTKKIEYLNESISIHRQLWRVRH